MKSVCVYCSSSEKVGNLYRQAARHLGKTLAEQGLTLVYGGGKTGLMGEVADGALEAGGQVIGVIVKSMNTSALAHTNLTRLEVTSTIHQRKARMYELAEGYIALPGGFGTLDELFETMTWAQIGLHEKPVGLLNINDFYALLMSMLERATREGFIYPEHFSMLHVAETPTALLEKMRRHEHPLDAVRRWMKQS